MSIREFTTSTAHTAFGAFGVTASEMRCTVLPVEYTWLHVAPRSVLRYTPFAVVPAPARAAHTMLSSAGSNSTSVTNPDSTVAHADPLLMLRCSPLLAAYSTTLVPCVPATLGATRIRYARVVCVPFTGANTPPPLISVQVVPPSNERSRPQPFDCAGSPVPTYTILGFTGSIAIEPILSEHWLSLIGVHVAPPLFVRHTPPLAAPAYAMLGLVGWIAMARIRPPSAFGDEP